MRAPSGAQKSLRGIRLLARAGGLVAAPEHCSTTRHPPSFPGARHTPPESRRGGSRRRNRVQRPAGQDDSPRLRSPEPYSTTSGPGVIPKALQMPPARGASLARSFTRLQRHPPARDSTPRVPPTTPEPDTPAHTVTTLPRPAPRRTPPDPPTSTPSPPYRPLHPPHHLHRPQPQALRPVDHEVSGDKPDTECRQPHDRRTRAGLAGGGSEASVITRAILQFEPFSCPIREVCGVRKCKIAGCSGGDRAPRCPESFAPAPITVDLGVVAPLMPGKRSSRGATTPRSAGHVRCGRGRRGRGGTVEPVLPLADLLTVNLVPAGRCSAAGWVLCDS
ncbi:hypothetical protein Micau_1688 [Micromonospora aurantiaca ATCC 27029]|nr:hypothetical protein Micau_1688 [Micromonospora aurantiaca ATCC 27029]